MSEPHWKIILSDEAKEDMRSLDGSQRVEVFRSIKKVSQNPLPTMKADMENRWETKKEASLPGA